MTREEIISKGLTAHPIFKPYSIGRIKYLTEDRPNRLFVDMDRDIEWSDIGIAYIVFTRPLNEVEAMTDIETAWKHDDELTNDIANQLIEYLNEKRYATAAAQTEEISKGKH